MSDITDRGYGYESGLYSRRLDAALERVQALVGENARLRRDLMVSAEALTQYRVALERCVGALEFVGCHERANDPCEFCKQVDEALALATPLIEKGRK